MSQTISHATSQSGSSPQSSPGQSEAASDSFSSASSGFDAAETYRIADALRKRDDRLSWTAAALLERHARILKSQEGKPS